MSILIKHICITTLLILPVCSYAQADYSNNSSIVMDEPSLAYVNISGIESMPTGKEDNLHAWFEYSDDKGNTFKKRIILNAQGASTLRYPKKNLSIDFCEDEWIGAKTTKFTIGKWVKQDAFHFKANWLDSFRGGLAIVTAYRLYDDITQDRPHILERAGMTDYSTKALCHPDGFPCIISLNGKFYGIYAWQLKKHRKNMGMEKDNPKHVWFQLDTYTNSLNNGVMKWEDISIRNPKNVTEESKNIIQKFANYNNELTQMSYVLTQEAMRQEIAKRYDVANIIDFILYGIITSNIDGFGKNCHFFTYDGVKWFVVPYDLDMTFGISWIASFTFPAEWSWLTSDYKMDGYMGVPYNWIKKYYRDEIKERYATLRKNGAISEERIMRHLTDWNQRVGKLNYDLEYEKWNTCPSNGYSINNKQWICTNDWSNYYSTTPYDNNKSYNTGDCCVYDYRVWTATEPVMGISPVVKKGYTDTEDRVATWLKRRLELMDDYLGYSSTGIQSIPVSKSNNIVKKRIINNRIVISINDKLFYTNGVYAK